ncbi:cyclic nucleotide-binding domain-containing protein [Pedobacter insulae]|uniref:cAMP-binding domain of CRP or a regulatory subunit of cAMP-dependent protein kinases n=1 Tax=Pedobacter insulae TaxID=414048 RepID=A0A1I2Y0X7_9SPHI|nr:hypothetical protein [Pedobacter insulae]SFH19410.1 hypothetical protein SAMN04489864_106164 [Pedobacter insulae]
MELDFPLVAIKLKIATYAALRPEAWAQISARLKLVVLKKDERFNRENSSLAYVINGLMKEHDIQARKKPAIVNFIDSQNFIITTGYNQNRFLKAITGTTIAYLDFESLLALFLIYKELKPVYDAALTNYQEGIDFRFNLLEERLATKRIQLFIAHYRPLLSYIRKKDMANYCHIPYDNFVRHYNNLL